MADLTHPHVWMAADRACECGQPWSWQQDYLERCELISDIRDHLPELHTHGLLAPDPAVIVELGVRSGNSTSAFLAALEGRPGGRLYSYDIEQPRVSKLFASCPWWEFHLEDARIPAVAGRFEGQADILFLDTDPHTFDSTYWELQLWGPRVRPGGVILAHDTDPEKFLGPGQAMLEYEKTCGRKVSLEFRTGCYGLGVMRILDG